MIEYPEARVLAGQAWTLLEGKTIEQVETLSSPHGFAFFGGDHEQYGARLHRRTVTGAKSFGGHLVFELGDLRLGFSDGVNLRYHAPGEARRAKHQFLMGFEDGSAVTSAIQMYGMFDLYEADRLENAYTRVAMEKPDLLTDAFSYDHFLSIIAETAPKPSLSAKALLATEQRIPGVGNGVLQDILFRAHIHPKRKITSLTEEERTALFRSIKETLTAMLLGGGRDVEKDLFGASGGYKTLLSSKTVKDPCPVCGSEIIRQAYLGGNVYFCPACQPLG